MNNIPILLTSKKSILHLLHIHTPIYRRLVSCTSFLVHQHTFTGNLWTNGYQSARLQSTLAKQSFLTKVKTTLAKVISDKTKVKVAGCLVYEKCADDINHVNFIQYFKLPDTFQSWFITIQLHVWICILITADYKHGLIFRNSLVDSMWHDVELRMGRLAEMKSSKKRKFVRELLAQFQAALIAFDEGILSEDPVLAAAVWRSVFSCQLVDPELLEKMVFYIRKQVNHLDALDKEAVILKGSVTFLPFTSIFSTFEKMYVEK